MLKKRYYSLRILFQRPRIARVLALADRRKKLRPRLRRFLLGVGAGAVALCVSFLVRLFFGGIFLPEVAVGALVTNTPGSVESVLVTNLQSLAKYSREGEV